MKTVSFVFLYLCSIFVFATENIPVKTSPLSGIAIYPDRSAPATVLSLNESTISSRLQSQVIAMPVKVGDILEKDSVFAKLDCSDYELSTQESRARLQSLKARIELARRRLERTRSLTLKQSVSEELLDERESDLAILQADLSGAKAQNAIARINQSRCMVTTPFRALILERLSAVGQFTDIGTELVKLIDIEQIEVSVQIFPGDTQQINNSTQLYFQYAEKQYPLSLRSISPAINTDTRNREVRLEFIDETAPPGAAGKLVWQDQRPHIPGEYLVRRDGKLGIFTVNQNRANFIPIPGAQAGRASPTQIPVDTHLVIEGQFALTNNDTVKTLD